MRLWFIPICLLLLSGVVFGQEPPPPPAQTVPEEPVEAPQLHSTIREVIPGTTPAHKNIFFIIDRSSSMSARKVAEAVQIALTIAETPLDDLQIAVVAFGNQNLRWPGTIDIDPETGEVISRPGWSLMPSVENLAALREWIFEQPGMSDTMVIPALHHVFSEIADIKDVSIIIISDCEFEPPEHVTEAITQHQDERDLAGKPEATIGIISIKIPAHRKAGMRILARQKCALGFQELEYEEVEPTVPFGPPSPY